MAANRRRSGAQKVSAADTEALLAKTLVGFSIYGGSARQYRGGCLILFLLKMPALKKRKLNGPSEEDKLAVSKQSRISESSAQTESSRESDFASFSDEPEVEQSAGEEQEQDQEAPNGQTPSVKTFKELGIIDELCDAC